MNKKIRKSYPTRFVRFFNAVCLRPRIYSSYNATLISLCILPDNEISRYVVWYKRYARFLKREPHFVAISCYKEVPTPLSTFIYQLTFSYSVSEHLFHSFICSFFFYFFIFIEREGETWRNLPSSIAGVPRSYFLTIVRSLSLTLRDPVKCPVSKFNSKLHVRPALCKFLY